MQEIQQQLNRIEKNLEKMLVEIKILECNIDAKFFSLKNNLDQRQKLAELAARQNMSISEISRRAIDNYIEQPESFDSLGLEQLADALIASNKNTKAAIDKAEETLVKTLEYFRAKKQVGNN